MGSQSTIASGECKDVVQATLNYVLPPKERLFYYSVLSDPAPGRPRTNEEVDTQLVGIHNVRPIASQLSLDAEGFKIVSRSWANVDYGDPEDIRKICYPETAELVKQEVGAREVIVYDHQTRRRYETPPDVSKALPYRQPVWRVHNDQTPSSGPQLIREYMGERADELLKRRYSYINLWRPLKNPVFDSPLAMCDARTISRADLVGADQISPTRSQEMFSALYNPKHRWCYFRQVELNEGLLFKCYDSDKSGVARFGLHGAFVDPTSPPGAPLRQSVEFRAIAFF